MRQRLSTSNHTRFPFTYTAAPNGESGFFTYAVPYNKENVARFRFAIYLSLTALLMAVPSLTFAATTGFFGPIIPESGTCFCDGGPLDWGCVLQVIQNLVRLAVSLGVIFCVFWIAFAGFSLIASRGNPESISTAKARIVSSIVGIAVILCSWLIVDFVMKAVYNPDATFSGGNIGPWNEILTGNGNDYCIRVTTPISITTGQLTSVVPSTGTTNPSTGSSGVGVAKGLCADSNTACSPAVMKAEGLNDAQANAMSCIAVTESGGNPNIGGSGTGAQGLFQITGTNWANPAYHSSPCTTSSSRDNAACNRQAAVLMFKKTGYQPWTGKCNVSSGCGNVSYGQYWNPNAVACVAKYDPQ